MNNILRKTHRWLGIFVAVQIIAWMVSGLWFSLFPIEEIRGEHLTSAPDSLDLYSQDAAFAELLDPPALQRALTGHFGGGWSLSAVELVRQDGRMAWKASGLHDGKPFTRLVDALHGTVTPQLTAAGAEREARRRLDVPGEVQAVEWIETAAPDSEVRGRALPLWRVRFSRPEALSLYLDPWTGEIIARRTTRWRIFDFLWMLHIMDFDTRDDFNHPLLQITAFAGLVIALSGVLLWALTTSLRRQRRRSRGS